VNWDGTMDRVTGFLKRYWLFAVTAIALLVFALQFIKPAPPSKIVFASGGEGGAYHAYAERYKLLFESVGVEVEVINTAGSIENIRLLLEEEADLALLQGGTSRGADADALISLGGLFEEPLWVFVRVDLAAGSFGDLRPYRLAIGADGSGTRMLVRQIQREFGGEWPEETKLPLSGSEAASALLAGDVDAAAFSASVEAPYIKELLSYPRIALLPFENASGIARRNAAVSPVTLLRGVVDVGKDIPAQDIQLIAPVAQLAARKDLHPAIQSLALEAAESIHTPRTLLAPAGTFPDGELTDLPLSKEARRFHKRGPSALRRWFPFGVANFLDRAWVLMIPLITLAIPLIRAAPPLYRWRIRRRIYIWYEDLRLLEERGREAGTKGDRDDVLHELDMLQQEIGKVEVPLSYNDEVFHLRGHVEFVRQLVDALDGESRPKLQV